jgi:hypothetical protein
MVVGFGDSPYLEPTMTEDTPPEEKRRKDPYLDRRSGEDRRQAYDIDYFEEGGTERRKGKDRRLPIERRKGCVKVSRWSSVCVRKNTKPSDG